MEQITIVENIGYYHPSNANLNYLVHLIIDKKGARLYRETFGGDSRLRERLEKEGFQVVRHHIGNGSDTKYAGRTVAKMLDIESYQAHKNY